MLQNILKFKSSLWLTAANVLVLLLQALPILFASHFFSIADNALLRQWFLVLSIGTALGSWGVAEAFYFYFFKNEIAPPVLILNAKATSFFIASITVICFFAFFPLFKYSFNSAAFEAIFPIILVGVWSNIYSLPDQNIAIATQNKGLYFVVLAVFLASKLAVLVIGYKFQFSIATTASLWGIMGIVQCLLFSSYGWKKFGLLVSYFNIDILKQLLKYGLPIGYGIAIASAIAYTDKLLIGYFIPGAESFAILANATFDIPFVSTLYISFSTMAMPAMIAAYAKGETSEVYALRSQYIKITSLVLFPFVAICIALSGHLVPLLFGQNYMAAIPLFMLFNTTLLLRFTNHHEIFQITHRTNYIIYLQSAEFVFNIIISAILIYYYGLLGAVLAAVITNFLYIATTTIFSARLTSVSILEIFPYGYLLKVALASAAFGYSLYYFIG